MSRGDFLQCVEVAKDARRDACSSTGSLDDDGKIAVALCEYLKANIYLHPDASEALSRCTAEGYSAECYCAVGGYLRTSPT